MQSIGFGNPFTDMTASSFKELVLSLAFVFVGLYIYNFIDENEPTPDEQDRQQRYFPTGGGGGGEKKARDAKRHGEEKREAMEKAKTLKQKYTVQNNGSSQSAVIPHLCPILEEPGFAGMPEPMACIPSPFAIQSRSKRDRLMQSTAEDKSGMKSRNGDRSAIQISTPPRITITSTTPDSSPRQMAHHHAATSSADVRPAKIENLHHERTNPHASRATPNSSGTNEIEPKLEMEPQADRNWDGMLPHVENREKNALMEIETDRPEEKRSGGSIERQKSSIAIAAADKPQEKHTKSIIQAPGRNQANALPSTQQQAERNDSVVENTVDSSMMNALLSKEDEEWYDHQFRK